MLCSYFFPTVQSPLYHSNHANLGIVLLNEYRLEPSHSQPLPLESNRQSWHLLTLLFALANFLEVAVVAHFVLFTPALLSAIGYGKGDIDAWTGPITSAGFIIGIWFVPFWGVLADRYGRKPLILRSYYVEVVAMAIAAISSNIWLYLFARALTGFALGNTGLMFAALTETTPRHRVALALGLVNGSAPLGSLVGGMIGGLIVANYGVHWLFGLDAIVAAMIAVVLTAFYRETFVPKETPPITKMLDDAMRAVIHTPIAATIFVISFVSNCAFFFSYPYLPVRIEEIVGGTFAPIAIGITQGLAGVTTLLGAALWGAVADRFGHRRLLVILILAVTILWLPIFAAQDIVALTVGWVLLNAVSSSVASLMITIISVNVPESKRGSILSMIYLPMNFAFIVGPFIAGFVASGIGVRYVFLVSSGLALLSLLILLTSLERTRKTANVESK
jgi:MFS transporter, DHA1 family, multidrug resistance protein